MCFLKALCTSTVNGTRKWNTRILSFQFAARALTIGLRNELGSSGSHVRVTQICPGDVVTEMAERAMGKEEADKLFA